MHYWKVLGFLTHFSEVFVPPRDCPLDKLALAVDLLVLLDEDILTLTGVEFFWRFLIEILAESAFFATNLDLDRRRPINEDFTICAQRGQRQTYV
jgi:hypothetical protein